MAIIIIPISTHTCESINSVVHINFIPFSSYLNYFNTTNFPIRLEQHNYLIVLAESFFIAIGKSLDLSHIIGKPCDIIKTSY